MTEIDAGTDTALTVLTNGHAAESPAETSIPNADIGDNAANAAGENQWDTGNDLAASQEWVEVKVPVETPQTETAPSGPATTVTTSTPSWADDHPVPTPSEVCQSANSSDHSSHTNQYQTQAATPAPAAADPNDGFQSVQRRGGNREGGFRGHRGRGRGGFGRGDGYRGRGRGGPRGGARGGPRRDAAEASS